MRWSTIGGLSGPPNESRPSPRLTARSISTPHEIVRLVLARTGYEPIVARTIIEVGGLFLVESADDLNNWYMGQRRPDGVLECWGQYGDLAGALRSL
jgi:hypothetical protein